MTHPVEGQDARECCGIKIKVKTLDLQEETKSTHWTLAIKPPG